MPDHTDIARWRSLIRGRYESYLKTSFYFKEPGLRASFDSALRSYDLLKGPFPEPKRKFRTGASGRELAEEFFPARSADLMQALLDRPLYAHQERAVRATFAEELNVVVATGTASGKTESFLYPILFDLYRQHLDGQLQEPGVRAMVLYPMNALANDQRRRLGEICRQLEEGNSGFAPTFGQYIGQTPENKSDRWRNAAEREEERLPGEMVFREEMRANPPHILLTNYSMLEYLLIRPEDSPLFDDGKGRHWKFIVLDEAHQYRGARGMEMGMLVRRLKQRLRDGGREGPFRCIATSATIASGEGEEDRRLVGEFAEHLFGEPFSTPSVVFGEHEPQEKGAKADLRRYHVFMRALEGAFLVHERGKDNVVLNRKQGETEDGLSAQPLEIALCRECGQHYYVGRESNGYLVEASRDPSQEDFGVDYFLPMEAGTKSSHILCRICGRLSESGLYCMCGAAISVKKCESHIDNRDQLKKCETCDYQRGGIGDPVQEIVHGSDGPNAVIATALHELLPEDGRKVLAFADSRQEAAFFAWYAQDSYEKLRDRNLILRALKEGRIDPEGLSIDDLQNRLSRQWDKAGLFRVADSREEKTRRVLTAILREAVTDERRLSLGGVGLAKWTVKLPDSFQPPPSMLVPPWNLDNDEARQLLRYLLDGLRLRYALALPDHPASPHWDHVSPERAQVAFSRTRPQRRKNVSEWGGSRSAVVQHFLGGMLARSGLSEKEKTEAAVKLMKALWDAIRDHDRSARSEDDHILLRANGSGEFRLNPRYLRLKLAEPGEVFECGICASVTAHDVRGICPRNKCPGGLKVADQERLDQNHYRILYRADLPAELRAEEHTAQIDSDEARRRQDQFKADRIHLLSSSTTFEIGVDLGDLEIVFLRNVPPEPFNYTQRAGRAGRRDEPGLVLTYCRRNPHDLYHYDDPEGRVIKGAIQPPRLRMTNEKIIIRHVAATALSAFFRHQQNLHRFHNVSTLIGDWEDPNAVSELRRFCEGNRTLEESLCRVVPSETHDKIGLSDGGWIETITGPDSRFAVAQAGVCADYLRIQAEVSQLSQTPGTAGWKIGQLTDRRNTIANESTLEFLSRKAIIPKYGFPVDVVELDTRPRRGDSNGVSLQRDLSQAIAEYAPGGKVVANKKEWESCGVKTIPGKQFLIKSYMYDDARTFDQSNEAEHPKKYLQPAFGFVTPLFEKPKEPRRRPQRLYTTRPFFPGFGSNPPETEMLGGIRVTEARPGSLVVLCEGKDKSGFYICRTCGRHMTQPKGAHKTPEESGCSGTLERFSLGHELVTDVVLIRFPQLTDQWEAYSLAYAVLLGAADTMDVPDMDLNVTITASDAPNEAAIVLYDNVPGGAGLVAELGEARVFGRMLKAARERLAGTCGCDSSCYGCLRSYRNQFAHPYLNRTKALHSLDAVLSQANVASTTGAK